MQMGRMGFETSGEVGIQAADAHGAGDGHQEGDGDICHKGIDAD